MQLYFILLLSIGYFSSSFAAPPIIADTGIGNLNTKVGDPEIQGSKTVYSITGGTKNSSNLFHSFNQFNIPEGNKALFKADPTLSNIFARITGGNQSLIDGTLRIEELQDQTIHSANFFLMNPSGIFFLKNAKLETSGSFYATTADNIAFPDNQQFNADANKDPPGHDLSLLTADPIAFGFLQDNPGNFILVQGSKLEVKQGKSLALVAKSGTNKVFILSGKFQAPSGRVEFAQTDDKIAITPKVSVPSASPPQKNQLDSADFDQNQDIYIRSGHLVIKNANIGNPSFKGKIGIDLDGDLTVSNGTIQSIAPFTKEPTAINIAANNVKLQTAKIDTSTSGILATAGSIKIAAQGTIDLNMNSKISGSTSGIGEASSLRISADNFTMQGNSLIQYTSSSEGNAGEITIEAKTIRLSEATINNRTNGMGEGANITLTKIPNDSGTSKTITITDSTITSSTTGGGKAGSFDVDTDQFTIKNSKILAKSSSSGKAGNISIKANNISTSNAIITNETIGTGSGGAITLQGNNFVTIKDGSIISSSTTNEAKEAGNLEVITGQFTIQNSEILAESSSSRDDGAAGNITITAQEISMADSSISNETTGKGSGGTIILKGDHINLTGSIDDRTISSSTENEAKKAGNIIVTADQFKTQNSKILAESKGSGNAGDITITANKISMADASKITNDTFQKGLGGAITIASNNLELSVSGGSQISSATSGSGNAGTVNVTADKVSVQNAVIQAISSGSGNAGNIDISSGETILSSTANITSSASSEGSGGTISMQANNIELSSGSRVSVESTKDASGEGGNILVQAPNVKLSENSAFTTTSDGSGNAGQIDFRVTSLLLNNATISSEALNSDGGNIRIEGNSPAKFVILKNDSAITTTVNGGTQTTGGNIQINSEFVVVQNSRIIAEAFAGTGGKINITAQGVFIDPSSRISASSALGIDGIVEIDAKAEVIDDVVGLPETYMPNIELRQQTCAQRLGGGKSSSFTVLEKPGMPIGPEDMLSGDFDMNPEFAITQVQVDTQYAGACQRRK